jgi:hypothetical protein
MVMPFFDCIAYMSDKYSVNRHPDELAAPIKTTFRNAEDKSFSPTCSNRIARAQSTPGKDVKGLSSVDRSRWSPLDNSSPLFTYSNNRFKLAFQCLYRIQPSGARQKLPSLRLPATEQGPGC